MFQNKLSGVRADRKGLSKALRRSEPGDVLIVWKLDRLGRSLFDLVDCAKLLHSRSAGLKILTGQGAVIDTTTAEGRLMFGILATMADFERELIRDRTRPGWPPPEAVVCDWGGH
ncbi:MAG: recombinase family protein [Rhizobiaceae bacterium]